MRLQASTLGCFDDVMAMLRGSGVSMDGDPRASAASAAAASAAAAASPAAAAAAPAPGITELLPSPPLLSVADVPWLQACGRVE